MSETTDSSRARLEPGPARGKRRRWLSWLVMLVMFLSGLGMGVGGTLIVVRQRVLDAFHHPEKAPRQIADRLRKQLGLNAEQMRQVEAIVRAHQVELRRLRRAVQPQVETQLDQVEEEIGRVLDDRQRVEWRERMAYFREVWVPARPED